MQGRYRGSRRHWLQRTALAVAVAACFAGNALANPTGPTVVHGQATITAQGNTLTITNTPGTVINWQGFSIAGNEIARFIQQSQSSSVLNRVVGINPSAILGTLQSNGRVFLVNPNGITIGPGANIDVAGFMASTLNLSDADFLAGRMRFTQTPGAGSVANHGTISTSTGGMVYLVGHDVQNSGIIRSPQGEILLAAGKSVELVDAQTPEVRVQLTAPDNQALNLGQLIAAGGRIGMYGTLVRNGGIASANTAVMGENGKIVFRAVKDVTLDAGSVTTVNGPQGGSVVIQAETGTASLSGLVEAKGETGIGGTVQVLGNQVGLFGNAGIDVSGQTGGGTVLIGGDFQGNNPGIQNAWRTYLGADATIRADAVHNGNGGKVILWSDDVTRAFGSVTARGGAQSGNGGFVEISGKQGLVYTGSVNTLAPFGVAGTLLLDPADLDIVATGNVDVNGASPFAPLGVDGAVSTLGWNTITGAGGLGGGNVVITTVGTPAVGSETGRIRIQAAGTYSSTNSLTINAASDIEVNAAVTNNGTGALTLDAQGGVLNVAQALTTTGGNINLSGSAGISLGADVTSGGGAIALNNAVTVTATNPAITAGAGNISFASTIDGSTHSLTTDNTGALTFGGAISNMVDLTIQGGPSSVALPQATLSGNLSVTSAGSITQTGALAVTGTSGIISTAGNVTLTDTGNNFGGLVTASGVDISLRDTNALNAAITATGAGMLEAGDNLAVSGSTGTTLQTTTTGTGTTSFGLTTVGSDLTVLSAAGVSQTDKLTVTGASGITASSGDIALAGFNNSFGGAVTANTPGSMALLTDATVLTLGNVAITGAGSLTLLLGADVTQTLGTAITKAGNGAVNIEANAVGTNVTLASATNDFGGGAVSVINGLGTLNNVSVRDISGSASIAALVPNIGGNLTLQFDNAGMTLPGVTVGGNVQIISGGTINVSGSVSSTGTVALTTTAGNIALGAGFGSSGAATTLISAGNITQTTGTVSGTDVTLDSATGVGGGTGARVSTTATNLAARSTVSGGVFVNDANAVTLTTLAGVANGAAGGGAYDLTAGGTINVANTVNAGAATGSTALGTSAGNIALGADVGNASAATTLVAAGNITRTAGTVSADDLTLDAGGLIGGASAVHTDTTGTLILNSGGVAVAGNITVSEANALPVGRVSLGGTGTGSGRTVSLTSVAGPVTLDAAIGNAADHLTLVAVAGNIAGAGVITATNLTLNAAGGIGAGTAVNTNTSGNLSLTTAGNAAAGDIALVETNALNTSRVTALGTTGTGTQSVSITAPSITLGAAIGTATDNLTLIAGSGAISGAATVTANDLRLDAFNGIGATGTPVFISTAGNLAARLTDAAASGAIAITEVAAGAGLTVGAANGLSGMASTNNRAVTLMADSGNIVLNQQVNSGSGQIQLTTTGSGDVSVNANVSGGLVNINAAGTIADSAQITGTTLTTSSAGGTVLDFGHAVTGFDAINITGGTIQLVNTAPTLTVTGVSQNGGGDVLINNTGALTINGAISNAGTGGAINLTGTTGINLNQNLTATDGNITLNNATTLGANVQIAAGTGNVTLTGATGVGANNLTVSSSDVTTITGGITGTTGNVDIAAATRTDVDGAIVLSGAGTVQLDRAVLSGVNVTTAGGSITFDGAAATDSGSLQVSSGGGNVLFNNTLMLGSGAGLTVLAGTGSATFAGAVDGPAGLAVTASGNTLFSSAVGTGTALASLATDGGGLTQINGGAVTTMGVQTYSDAVTLGANTTLSGAGITFSSTLDSVGVARTLQINDSGTTTFSGAVGNTLRLASLTTNTGGTTAINGGSVATTGAQAYSDAVTLGLNATLTGIDITFSETLNSSGASRTLQINDSGTTTFGSLVGNTLALASLTTDTGGTTAINTTSLNTTGAQTYNDAVTLGANAVLASSGSGDISFIGTVNGPSGLTVNTAGNTIFSAAVGGTTPLASLTTDAAGSTQVNGGAVTTVGAQTYNDGITIAGSTTFNATATTATLDFNATLAAAAHALTLTADEINFAGGAGTVTGSGAFTLQPNNTAAAINIGSAAGATVGALDLAVADLAALADGFSAITIGQAAGTHAMTIGNAVFQDSLLVRTPAGGSVNVNGALSLTENVAFNIGGVMQGGGSITAPRVTIVAGGIGSLATPLQLDTAELDVQNSAGNAVMVNAGPVNLLNNFRNTAAGGELRLIANNGAINTGAVAVQSAGGRIALIANDATGGATGNVIVGTGGIASVGGDIALHAADNITINGAMTAGAGNVRMLAGTGPGINAAHASFTGANPPAPTELATDEFGFIVFNAPVSAANMVLVSSTSTTPTVINAITQTAAGAISTTGALTAVTLRGGGAPGNGGGTVDLNDATGNNSTGLINLFACSFDGCPNPLPTVPFVNQGAPVPPFTTAVYSDGQLFYSDVGGTNVTGIGTSGDFTLYTPGSVTITGPSLSAKNLTIEALADINVNLLAPFTNNDINGGQPGGSLNFIAGQNVNYTSMVAGATIGTAATPFNHDLKFQAAGNVTLANSIYIGTGNFVVRVNQAASLDGNTINIPATGTGSVLMQGNHVVSSMGDLTVSGVNLTVQGGDTGSPNQSVGGQQLLSAGTIALNLTGDVNVTGGTATANSDSGALVRGAVVNVGSAGTPVANLGMTGGNSTVTGTTDHEADALIEGTTTLNVYVAGNVGLTGGSAAITGTAGSSQKAGASAILKGNSFIFNVAGNITLTGGTANSATGGNTATANAQIVAGSAFSPVIQGDLNLIGGSATAQPITGQIANAVAAARFGSDGNLQLNVGGNIDLQGGTAVAINNSGGAFAEADAGAFVNSGAKIGINAGQNFDITGGSATATGSSLRAIASAGVTTGEITAGESLLISTAGNMNLTGGTGAGAAADAAALIYSAAEAKLNISGAGGLRLEGGSGPFFPPFGSGVFTPSSGLFHMIGGNSLVLIEGGAYPITVTGLITVVPNPALGAALFISEAPPLSLDSLLAAFIKTTDCVSFSGGSCTLSGATASGSGKTSKDPAGGVCK